MIKRILALVVLTLVFGFNCKNGCGSEKKDEMKMESSDKATDGAMEEGAMENDGEMMEEHK